MKNIMKLGTVLLLYLCCANLMAQFNYGEALQKSLYFYEAQQSGVLPDWNRVSWRANAALGDGSDVGTDLTGGWFDAGDHVKFGFPMAFSVTTLAWGAIEYEDAYRQSGQLDILKRNLRFVTDYFIKCHTAPNEFYGQLGNGGLDHAFWGSPEVMVMQRPAYKIDAANPGSDLASETAAALAAVSILFKDDDPVYSATLVQHAKQLYDFADNFRGKYSDAITDAAGFYRSFSGYQDEIVWGAAWLYRATNDPAYLTKAESEYNNLGNEGQSANKAYKFTMSWDDKSYGSYVLLAQLTGNDKYKADAERFLDFWTSGVNGERVTYSPGGQAHLIQWGSLRYAANTSFLALIYSDKVATSASNKQKYHDFAVDQVNYALGDNPINRSYMVGFGNNPANAPHHRSSHGGWANSLQNRPDAQSHTLFGALVGGPSSPDDQFVDDRGDFIANEVATDYNACFTGVLVRMYEEFGGNPLTNFPINETPSRSEIRSVSKFNSDNPFGSTIRVLLQNRTSWPARITDKLSYRYFFDISEGVAQGFTINDYDVNLNSVQGNSTMTIGLWDAAQNIYYAEVSLAGEQISPIGDPQFRRETQLNFRVSNGVPYDTSNDWSAQGLNGSSDVESINIPVYDNGVLVFGNEPGGGNTPTASFTVTPESGVAPLEVLFDASASSDPNGDALSYNWNFGNGETSFDVNPSIIYSEPGSYLVTLTVSDGSNISVETRKTITVENGNPDVRDAPVIPDVPSSVSGVYRNMFVESGQSSTLVGQKLNDIWNQYFVNGDINSERLYYETGADMAYILDTGNNDIRSEGMSYAMMICVQLDKKAEFDKLWKFAKTYSQHRPGTDREGLFSWQLNRNDFSKIDVNSAPDGEEYFVTALFFADARWGSQSGPGSFDPDQDVFDYRAQADYILDNMLNKASADSGACPTNLVDLNQKQIVFGICGQSAQYTDPSYHLPAFYEIWAESAANNNQLWADMAARSRTYLLPNAAHPVTGLMPDYSEFDGRPRNIGTHGNFEFDAWRNIMNMGFDFAWYQKNRTDIQPLINRQIDFFKDKPNYASLWTLDGTTNRTDDHSPGLVACNAVGSLALEDAKVWPFIDELFELSIPSGQFRYYDGLLYMMSYMHLAGEYKIYKTDVVDGDPTASFTATPEYGVAPLEVTFDASGSSDPAGGNLTYSWNLGDGNTANTVTTSTTYTEVGEFTVTLIVTNSEGKTDTSTKTINVTDGTVEDCSFGTPITTALPAINTAFENIFVLGEGGPNLDNVTNFTINWDLANNGLYQFSMNTSDGNPDYWNDFLPKITQSFNTAQPEATLSNTGFSGLDGAYWVTIDNGNFVMVSKTGGFTIYFSTTTTAPNCEGGTTNPTINGGTIAGGPFVFTVGDGIADNVSGITLTGTVGETNQWIVTDAQGKILGLPTTPEAVDFDGAGVGSCFIYNVTYNGTITGLAVDGTIAALSGGFDLSNSIEVVRNPVGSGGDCTFNTPMTTSLPSINSAFENIYVIGNGGPNLDNVTIFTINWDLANNGLYQFSMNTNNGTPDWYVDFLPKVEQNFNSALPEIAIAGSGFTGLDGSYWVAIDGNNLALVSKTGGFTIYFSTSVTAPDCGDGPTNTAPVANISATPISGEAPLVVTFDASGSNDADGDALTYSWDFADGSTGDGVTNENTFDSIGEYEVTLTVSDGNGGEDQAKITIKATDGDIVINPPTGDNEYIDRFIEIRNEFYDPANGYFSADGSPHHSIESLIVEAPDHGHESTSELYSYWLWLEVMNGRITKDWQPLNNVWNKIEQFIIPTTADQPSNSAYNASSPAAYASEFPLPSNYPAPLEFNAPVGSDPVSPDLTATYGPDIYQMHWLLDNDNFYGYGNRGDGVSTPSYINTFQRGEQESVFETVPHPSWESFDWGGTNGFLPLFIEDQNYAKQWRYTSAPDADARAVQAMYWAQVYAKEQGTSLGNLDLDKASKMGDYLRLSMFDKYFKPLGVQSATSGAGTGYDSAHYLMSWYMSWGGSADPASQWAFRISSSHCHFGYQNPVAAYALTQVNELKPKSQNGERDWAESLKRQMEFYTWLQSKEGAIAGGATNSWNGDYSPYPAGKSTFYDMAFDTNPVYHDPGSGTWFGWQAWSMERVAEYYYITNDPMAKNLMDKWTAWVKSEVKLIGANDFEIPATLAWSGEPDNWNPASPGSNSGLSVTVTNYSKDLGVAASMAKALIYYAAATEKHSTLDVTARDLAKEVLDRMWVTYRDDKGVSSPEDRGDFKRIFEEEVYIPQGFTGTMANGDVIQPGVSFLDIRSGLKNDPDYDRLKQAYDAGTDFTQRYHRSWAQIEVALANAEYGFFFANEGTTKEESEPLETFKIVASPNPAVSYVNITTKENLERARLRLMDLTGNVITLKHLNNKQNYTRLSIEGLPTGIYILEILDYSKNQISRKKIVVQK